MLGDSIFDTSSNDVVARSSSAARTSLRGITRKCLFPRRCAGARAGRIDPRLLAFLAGHRIGATWTAGASAADPLTPWEPRGEYVHPHSAKLERFAEADADIVLYGHTHCQVVKRIGILLVINPARRAMATTAGTTGN